MTDYRHIKSLFKICIFTSYSFVYKNYRENTVNTDNQQLEIWINSKLLQCDIISIQGRFLGRPPLAKQWSGLSDETLTASNRRKIG